MTAPKTAPKTPQDRLGKLPRCVTVGIYLDDSTCDAVNAADADLTAARERLDASRPRRLAEARAIADAADVIDPDKIRAAVDAADAAELAPLEKAATTALDAMDAATRWFTSRSLGNKAYRALREAHPAREQDHEFMANQESEGSRAPWNLDTFPRAIVQASSCDPALTDEEITDIFDGTAWNDVEINTLVVYAQLAQTQAPVADPKRRKA